jgi:hypothetical protein
MVLATDFGDAPDTAAGTGAGNYETLLANNGPRHTIVAGLFLGARVDGEADATPNAKANGDDLAAGAQVDDEDGVVNPEADLRATAGTQPTITLRATNTTGTLATLSGWIDTNGDGTFDNATERAQIAVPTGTNNGLFTLTLPTVPAGFFGKTYARFRLSTDAAAGNATGLASDGEVEDYRMETFALGDGTVRQNGAVSTLAGGSALTSLGDFDGDGINDLARASTYGGDDDPNLSYYFGRVTLLLLRSDGTVKESIEIKRSSSPLFEVEYLDGIGTSIASMGDLDGDGVVDLAVGAPRDGKATSRGGAVQILFLNANGTVKSTARIAGDVSGSPTQVAGEYFGGELCNLGDIDGDGIVDLAVSGSGNRPDNSFQILFLRSDGSVKSFRRGLNGGPQELMRSGAVGSIANIGDLNQDGVTDLAIGTQLLNTDSDISMFVGAVCVLFLNPDGSVKSFSYIDHNSLSLRPASSERFAVSSLASLGDLDGDNVNDLAVGSSLDGGSIDVLYLNADGGVKSSVHISAGVNGGPMFPNRDIVHLGGSLANIGDINHDGAPDLASNSYILPLNTNYAPTDLVLSPPALSGQGVNLSPGTEVGRLGTIDSNSAGSFVYAFAAGVGSDDNDVFAITGDRLRTTAPVRNKVYSIRVRTTDQGGLIFEKSFTITVSATNTAAPVLDTTGNPFAVLGVGGRQSTEMRQGTLVSEILARGAGGDPISDADAGAQDGIAVTAFDASLGTFQYTLVSINPAESDWKNLDADGALSEASALLLPATARVRFVTALVPHHVAEAGSLPLESKLATGLTFRAWDLTAGLSGGRADTTTNGGTTAFSTATETATVYFEARMWRSFNTNAQLNVYTLEKEFNALLAIPGYTDRSTSAFTGFTVLLSAIPELTTAPLFRMYFGVQFNDDGTETDMGYRYLTPETGEAGILEGLGKPEKRPTREGAYFRELGVNNGTAVLGYVYTTQQPGTAELTQIYRTDPFDKPTRPGGTAEGSTPTSTKSQEQGDHVYTTNTAFETGKPGTWRVERARGFARELTPSPTSGPPAVAAPALVSGEDTSGEARRRTVAEAAPARDAGAALSAGVDVARLVAVVSVRRAEAAFTTTTEAVERRRAGKTPTDAAEVDTAWSDAFFADAELVGAGAWGL